MKKLISFLSLAFFVAFASNVSAQDKWIIDASHSTIGFSVTHLMISEATGKFTKFEGSLTGKKEDFSDATVELTIDAASVNTEDPKRDGHLKGADFFDVEKFPKITFKSKEMKLVSGKNYKLTGDLTMHGVTKTVTLDVEFKGSVKNPWGMMVAAFKLTGKINRQEFGVKWSKALDNGGTVVGDEVIISGTIELTKKA
ncbi:MAG: YceI family protein [Chloroherpetonaceae bacterium]|nr:YceI family protein [Chloroherpetonaceae bacterium]